MSTGGMFRLFVTHWQTAWGLDVQAILYTGLYVWAAWRARPWPIGRTISWLAGVACVLLALQSGIASYDDRLLSVHMVQHMLLLMLAPTLLLSARPARLALRVLHGPHRRALARGLHRLGRATGPLLCLAAYSLILVGTHLPAFYDATLGHAALHEAEHAAYLLAGLLMWWPLIGADPVPAHRLGGLGRLLYVLATMPAMALVGAYLNRATALVYTPYGPPARALGVNPVVDQAQAGALMWVTGTMTVTLVGLAAVIGALVAEERRQQAREARPMALEVSPADRSGR